VHFSSIPPKQQKRCQQDRLDGVVVIKREDRGIRIKVEFFVVLNAYEWQGEQ
jgi:hypothetical protein